MEQKIVTIEKIVFGGKGLSRDLGKIVLVPFTLPGEKVRIRLTKEYRDYLEGEVIDVLEPSAERVPPACRYFGRCGGCQISHAAYDTQVRWKKAILQETLQRNKLQVPEIQVVTADPLAYRHRARLKFHAATGALGFYQNETNRIVDIQECLCLTPGLARLFSILRAHLHGVAIPGLSEIDCYENDRGETAAYVNAALPPAIEKSLSKATILKTVADSGQQQLTIKFRNYDLPMRPDIFLQVNPKLWKSMIQEVEAHYKDRKENVAVELYCGAGFFTNPLSEQFELLHACEENPSAISFAKKYSSRSNVRWHTGKAENYAFPSEATALIVDPPRSGLGKGLVHKIVNHRFRRVTYVSCDCPSFARDLKSMLPQYRLKTLVLFDLFPQTFHFETIALLERSAGEPAH